MTPPTDLHPEYGYLCPSPRLHRDARVAVISVLLGVIMGGIAVIALVDLAEGPRMMSRLRVSPEDVRIGLGVRVAFERLRDDVTLPVFEARSR